MEGMRYAEKRCCHLCMGLLAYSPSLMLWQHKQSLWSLICKRKLGGLVHSSRIQRLAHCCGIDSPLSVSLLEAQTNFLAAKQEYLHLEPQATEFWEDYLRHQLVDPFLLDEMHVAAQWQLSLKKTRNDFRLIRKTLGGPTMQSVHQVETAQGSDMILHTSQSDMEYHLHTTFEKCFQLAAHTPLLQEPLASSLGSFRDLAAVEAILN